MKNLGQGLLIRPAWFFGVPMNLAIQLEFLGHIVEDHINIVFLL